MARSSNFCQFFSCNNCLQAFRISGRRVSSNFDQVELEDLFRSLLVVKIMENGPQNGY